jgi:hypothetical protein
MITLKILNPIDDPFLSELRFRMGAKLLPALGHGKLTQLLDPDAIRALGREGILLDNLDQLKVEKDKTLSFKGQRVVLYIRDQNKVREDQSLPKFHVSYCGILDKMKSNNRWHRYVVANPDEEIFTINWVGDKTITQSEKLDVCQSCLDEITWDGFSLTNMGRAIRLGIVDKFKLKIFFEKYPKDLMSVLPKYTVDTAPLNTYTDDFELIRQQILKDRRFTCDYCELDLSMHSRWLNVHHENGDKSDNRTSNLELLCYDCHANQPYHSHMKGIKRHDEFISNFGFRYSLVMKYK